MYMEFRHNAEKDNLKYRIDDYVSKMENLRFQGNFEIIELNKSWINHEMQYSIIVKMGVLERRVKGILKIKDDLVIISMELPETIKNFITEEKLQKIISRHLENLTT
jgi:hypothetical protein